MENEEIVDVDVEENFDINKEKSEALKEWEELNTSIKILEEKQKDNDVMLNLNNFLKTFSTVVEVIKEIGVEVNNLKKDNIEQNKYNKILEEKIDFISQNTMNKDDVKIDREDLKNEIKNMLNDNNNEDVLKALNSNKKINITMFITTITLMFGGFGVFAYLMFGGN